jgi:XTP/dITP diphosphohydrolase
LAVQLVLATNNEDKIREITRLLEDLPITILSRRDFLEFPDPEESGTTLEENALIKARTIAEFTGFPALADDSGLEVDAINGAPGVYSSRYAGPNATYKDNCRKLVNALSGFPEERRTARFRCVIAIAWDEATVATVYGEVDGLITADIAGEAGFGYDPVFYHPPSGKRFSQMSMDEKNAISHRGLALAKARDVIIERLRRR